MVQCVARPVGLADYLQFGDGRGVPDGTVPDRGLLALLLLILRLAAVSVFICAVLSGRPGSVGAQGSPWGKDYLPNVTVLDQSGRPLKFYDDVIKGKIVVVSFLYTSCTDMCPLVTARLASVKDELGPAAGTEIVFVSISIDPIPDTPDKLKAMADAFKIGEGWLFLTGDPGDIDAIRFKLGERSKVLSDHRNEVMLYNDKTGEWARDSAFADKGVLAETIRGMDPEWRNRKKTDLAATSDSMIRKSVGHSGEAFFIKICASCHTVGRGDKAGPDLAGISRRREKSWLTRFLAAPQKLRAEKDPIALALREKYPYVRMPNLGMSDGDIEDVLSYLYALDESKPGAAVSTAGSIDGATHPSAH